MIVNFHFNCDRKYTTRKIITKHSLIKVANTKKNIEKSYCKFELQQFLFRV